MPELTLSFLMIPNAHLLDTKGSIENPNFPFFGNKQYSSYKNLPQSFG
jgi:hypothetical protein